MRWTQNPGGIAGQWAMFDFRKEEPVLLADVAKRFKVSRRTVDKWIARGLEVFQVLGEGAIYTTWEAVTRAATDAAPNREAISRNRGLAKQIAAEVAAYAARP